MDDSENPVIIEGLAAIASTAFEMGKDEASARADLITWWESLGRPAYVFQAAAAAMKDLPQPLNESADTIERMRPTRESLGVTSADMSLVSALQGRELLERLAIEFG